VCKIDNLEEAAANERKNYMRKWREANKDKVKKHQEKYWLKKAQERLNSDENE
jgi:hypothetical protein